MSGKVMIFGTMGRPYTSKAREGYGEKAVFFDVESDPQKLEEMLKLSGGRKQVPVIVEGNKATVGFGGA
jgi:glutaredoxin 3